VRFGLIREKNKSGTVPGEVEEVGIVGNPRIRTSAELFI
jgi:hypothetical protein